MAKVVAVAATPRKNVKRLGFAKGKFSVPDDFDRMFEKEIEQMFYGEK